ncbi:MAG: S41 family peptidase, partial [Hyphomonadaceae bacterium]
MAMALTMSMALYSSLTEQDPVPEKKSANLFDTTVQTDPDLRGTWQSIEYGWILDINETSAALYDVTDADCTEATALLESFETYFHAYVIVDDQLRLIGMFDPYTYYFDRAPNLPTRCRETKDDAPQVNFSFFVDVMSAHYAFFKTRGVDWQAIVEANAPRITAQTSDDELWSIFRDMLRPIKDGHVALRRTDGRQYLPGRGKTMLSIIPLAQARGEHPQQLFEMWYADYARQIRDDLLDGKAQWQANDRVIFGLIDGDIGYINIRSMGGYVENIGWTGNDFRSELDVLNAALDQAMELFKDATGVIIDVSDNSGGFGVFGDHIASRFMSKDLPGNYRFPAVNPNRIQQEATISPSKRERFSGPVIVLSSNLTVSAGESFLMTMRLLPQVKIAGEPTRGALSEVLTKTLPNGWELDLSNEHYLDIDMA